MGGEMRNQVVFVAVSMLLALSGCKTMETADKKMQTVDKKVNDADTKFRKSIGLKPYKKDDQSEPTDSN